MKLLLAALRDLARTTRGRLWATVAVVISAGLTEGVGLLLLVPLLGLIGLDTGGGDISGLASVATDMFDALGLDPTVMTVLGIYVGLVALRAALLSVQVVLVEVLAVRFGLALQRRVHRAWFAARWPFLVSRRSSEVAEALTSGIDRVGVVASHAVVVFSTTFLAALHFGLALAVSPLITLIAAGIGLLLLAFARGPTSRIERVGAQLAESLETRLAIANEHATHTKSILALAAQARAEEAFVEAAVVANTARVRAITQRAWVRFGFQIGAAIGLAAIVGVGLGPGEHTPTAVLLLVVLLGRMLPRLGQLNISLHLCLQYAPSWRAVVALEEAALREAAPRRTGAARVAIEQAIVLRDVGHSWASSEREGALQAVDLEVPAGQITALVGPSGSGKTTIADLLLGLLEPTRGAVLYDGQPLGGRRLAAAYVAQDAPMFRGTIRDNLRWSAPDPSEQDVSEALEAAAAKDFVARLPLGLDTEVGDQGMRLSGGERQRIALARALVGRPALLVLDEVTSALDPETERAVLETVAGLRGRVTIVLVSHRAAARDVADRVYRVGDGVAVLEASSMIEALA